MNLFRRHKQLLTAARATRLFEAVKSEPHPDVKDLEMLKNFNGAPVGTQEELQALHLKYDAMVYQPTSIEKTTRVAPYGLEVIVLNN